MQVLQRYCCRLGGRTFSFNPMKNAKYPAKIILKAISLYNLGFSQEEVCRKMQQRFKCTVSQTALSSWIKRYSSVCAFRRLRARAIKLFTPGKMVFRRRLLHSQVYEFQLHKAKLELLKGELPERKFSALKSYLESVSGEGFPHHVFRVCDEVLEQRASRIKGELLEAKKLEKENQANRLAELALTACSDNYKRHSAVQDFMVANDSVTVAAEVPVYLTNDDIAYYKKKGFSFDFRDYRTPITGHIDLVQVRNGCIHILDFKPEAGKEKPIEQLVVYALALASRTKLAVKDFKCAWFDDSAYYEFFPLHAVYGRK